MSNRKQVIQQLNASIRELQEAKKFVKHRRFERAEDEIGDSLKFTGKSLRKINRLERKKHH